MRLTGVASDPRFSAIEKSDRDGGVEFVYFLDNGILGESIRRRQRLKGCFATRCLRVEMVNVIEYLFAGVVGLRGGEEI